MVTFMSQITINIRVSEFKPGKQTHFNSTWCLSAPFLWFYCLHTSHYFPFIYVILQCVCVCVCVCVINKHWLQAAAHDSLALCRRASRMSRGSQLLTLSLQMMMQLTHRRPCWMSPASGRLWLCTHACTTCCSNCLTEQELICTVL